jgi:prophage tail gpP-like protein
LNLDNISIHVDEHLFLTGSVDTVNHSIAAGETITLSGRSALAHVLDSSYLGISEHKKISVEDMIKAVLKGFKLNIQFEITKDYTFEKFQTNSGQDIHSILNRIASEAQVFYSELPDGSLRVFQTLEDSVYDLDLANIKTRSYAMDKSKLNSEIVVRGQTSGSGRDALQVEAKAINDAVRTYRPLVITNQHVTNKSATALAQWVMAGQIANAVKFNYTMTINARVPLGEIIRIDDDLLDISGRFVVNNISHTQDSETGSETQISLVLPQSFEFEPYIKELKSKKSKKVKKAKTRIHLDSDADGVLDTWGLV